MTESKLEICMVKLKKDIEHIRKTSDENFKRNENCHKDIKITIEKEIGEIRKLFEESNKKFANKWVETSIIWFIRIVISAVVLAMLGLVLVK